MSWKLRANVGHVDVKRLRIASGGKEWEEKALLHH